MVSLGGKLCLHGTNKNKLKILLFFFKCSQLFSLLATLDMMFVYLFFSELN